METLVNQLGQDYFASHGNYTLYAGDATHAADPNFVLAETYVNNLAGQLETQLGFTPIPDPPIPH
jgi:hypothetical protein